MNNDHASETIWIAFYASDKKNSCVFVSVIWILNVLNMNRPYQAKGVMVPCNNPLVWSVGGGDKRVRQVWQSGWFGTQGGAITE